MEQFAASAEPPHSTHPVRQTWTQNLPRTVQAVYVPIGGDESRARRVRDRFVRTYGLSSEKVPLFRLDRANLEAPFSALR